MLDLDRLKKALKSTNSSWYLSQDIPIEASEFMNHGLGALTPPLTMATSFNPRIGAKDCSAINYSPISNVENKISLDFEQIPTQWDWNNVDGRSFITNQETTEYSSASYAIINIMEALLRIKNNLPNTSISLSKADLDESVSQLNNIQKINDRNNIHDFLSVCINQGVCLEVDFADKHKSSDGLKTTADIPVFRIKGYDSTTDKNQMKRWIVQEGPLLTSCIIYEDFEFFWKGGTGIYTHISGLPLGSLNLCVIGYDDLEQYWICKTYYRPTVTHLNGIFKIKYKQCNIDSQMYLLQDIYTVY